MQILYIYFLVYYFKFIFLVFPGVTVCNTPGDCGKCFIIEKYLFLRNPFLICTNICIFEKVMFLCLGDTQNSFPKKYSTEVLLIFKPACFCEDKRASTCESINIFYLDL